MKNILNYYYGIILEEKLLDNGYFTFNNHLFCLYELKRNINEMESLLFLNSYMLERKIHVNRIIVNNYKEVVSFYDGKAYVLLLVNYEYTKGYFNFILAPINNKLDILKRNDWATLWSIKIDYIEYQIKHLENKYPLLLESVNYYIGMAENAISYFKMLNLSNMPLYINHRRISKNDLYNPLELVIDYKVRDLAEYVKETFIKGEKTIYEIKKFLNNINLSNLDYILLYDRMLYPSFYFDVYEKVVNEEKIEEEITKITSEVNSYEELLYEVYHFIKKKTNILGIEWINNKFR